MQTGDRDRIEDKGRYASMVDATQIESQSSGEKRSCRESDVYGKSEGRRVQECGRDERFSKRCAK